MSGQARPAWLTGALRSDHAGETGAVAIYSGILSVSRDPEVRAFARDHIVTEARHLREIEALLEPRERSMLLPLWRVMGRLTGMLPALFGPTAVFATIEAVETFVDRHYQVQIDRLTAEGGDQSLRDTLDGFRRDEVHHRDDAASRRAASLSWLLRLWTALVGFGSAAAVAAAARF